MINTNIDTIHESLTKDVPQLLQVFLKNNNSKGLPIGVPIGISKYDVYLQEQANALIYLNRNCISELEKNSNIYIHIYPKDIKDLPVSRQRIGYEVEDIEWISRPHYKRGTDCIGTFGLPNYDIDRIIVGQYTPYLGTDWATEYEFADNDQPIVTHTHPFQPIETYNPYYSYYRLVEPSNRIIDSTFSVHLISTHHATLVYTKNPCNNQSISLPFFLHIIPVDTNDLPVSRRELGFENYDFQFNKYGVIFDDKCLAMITIPDYEIASIRTGQFNPDNDHIPWQEETIINQ